MMNLLNIPIGTRVLFYDDNEKEVFNFEATADELEYNIPINASKVGFMFLHSSYSTLSIEGIRVNQPIIFVPNIDVSKALIPDPIFDNKSIDAQEKFPFHWVKRKLEDLFNTTKGDSLDGSHDRIMKLASVMEASIREILDKHPTNDNSLICPTCTNKTLKDFNAMIDHLTSSNCVLFENLFNSSFILDKEKIKACLHTIRVARNKLVHQLEVTSDDMNEIEGHFELFKDKIPFGGNRWLKLNQISIHCYCYLQNIIHTAYTHRANQLVSMDIVNYFDAYIDTPLEFVSCSISFED